MKRFRFEDCSKTGYGFSIEKKAVLLSDHAPAAEKHGKLFFCMGGDGAGAALRQGEVFLVSLSDGERCRCSRGEVIGIVKPELLPDEAKLHLSQLRPPGAADLNFCAPEYSGYSFLPDGRYASGVWLAGPEEVKGYVEMQKDYQHRVLICDRDDFAVLEIVEGKLVFPDEQALQEFYKEHQSDGGMTMV